MNMTGITRLRHNQSQSSSRSEISFVHPQVKHILVFSGISGLYSLERSCCYGHRLHIPRRAAWLAVPGGAAGNGLCSDTILQIPAVLVHEGPPQKASLTGRALAGCNIKG